MCPLNPHGDFCLCITRTVVASKQQFPEQVSQSAHFKTADYRLQNKIIQYNLRPHPQLVQKCTSSNFNFKNWIGCFNITWRPLLYKAIKHTIELCAWYRIKNKKTMKYKVGWPMGWGRKKDLQQQWCSSTYARAVHFQSRRRSAQLPLCDKTQK